MNYDLDFNGLIERLRASGRCGIGDWATGLGLDVPSEEVLRREAWICSLSKQEWDLAHEMVKTNQLLTLDEVRATVEAVLT